MKKFAFCFDGTWNRVVEGYPTNVAKLAHSVASEGKDADGKPVDQIIYYDEGVGTHDLGKITGSLVNKISGALGFGVEQNIVEAYTFLILNYVPGDEIYVFGFSRGAFTARSFVGLLRNVAILPKRKLFEIRDAVDIYTSRGKDQHPSSAKACEYRYKTCPHLLVPGDIEWRDNLGTKYDGPTTELKVNYVGVWDTVGALGVPEKFGLAYLINKKYRFHDTKLSKFVKSARHAVAADEERSTFAPAMWDNIDDLNHGADKKYQQRIFPGTHSAVGGGGPKSGISDATLEWIFRGALDAGLSFDTQQGSPLYGLLPDHRDTLFNEENKYGWTLTDKILGAGLEPRSFHGISSDDIDSTIIRRWHDPSMSEGKDGEYRPKSLEDWHKFINENPPETDVDLDEEIFEGIARADNELRQPIRIEKYEVMAQDRWSDIAKKYYEDEKFWKAIFLFNFAHNVLYDPKELHATREILIPIYE